MSERKANGTTRPVIFISYSHRDEPDHPRPGEVQWLSFVREYLQPAVKFGIVDLWVDRHLPGGSDFDPEIERKLRGCDIFMLLISAHSMASNYIVDKEIAVTRERQANGENVHFYPLLLTPTPKIALKTLEDKLIRPPDGKPLSSFPYEERIAVMTTIADEVGELAGQIAEKKRASVVTTPQIRLGSIELKGEGHLTVDTEIVPRSVEIDTVHLPETPYERLVGRDEELKRLDEAWMSPSINIFSLVAEGGAGKSALVNEWLACMQTERYRGAEAVLGWSFYSQGSKERATSADQFLNWALDKLGIKLDTTSASAKGEAIAEAMAKHRVLLLLDGVEPLQHGPGTQTGQLKDLGLRALLRRFSGVPPGQPHGLIMITSRLAIADITRWKDTAAPVLEIEKLSDEAGAALLRDNGVWGTDKELKAAARDFAGHPLALGLLASFLKETQFGDVRRRDHIRAFCADDDDPRHGHAKRVMESYENEWLSEPKSFFRWFLKLLGLRKPSEKETLLAIMHMVGLFDRPASSDCLQALREKPAIGGLTDAIVDLSEDEWNRAVARLREVRLLSPLDPSAREALDAHPLVRDWFGESLRKKDEKAWCAAHSRLYEHLRYTTKEGDEPTLEQLAPLYQAIAHGCRAGRHQEALREVFEWRIFRYGPNGNPRMYSTTVLGAHGSDLEAISWFFDKAYETPVTVLSKEERAWVLSEAAVRLRAQRRFEEALAAGRAALRMHEAAEDWTLASIDASHLSQVELLIGEIALAAATAERAVECADRSGDLFFMMAFRTIKAHALHAAGHLDALDLFVNALRRQKEACPDRPLLCGPPGYRWHDMLLAEGFWIAARIGAAAAIEPGRTSNRPLDIGLGTLTLARANLGLSLAASEQSTERQRDARIALVCARARAARAAPARFDARFDQAVDSLRAAGLIDFVPRGLLARAVLRRSIGDWVGATRDLDEVEEIAEPGAMKLCLCDMAIERARLAFAQIEAFAPLNGLLEKDNPPRPSPPSAEEIARLKGEAGEQLKIVENYIASCGYHKRDEELAELEDVLAGSRRFAGLPPRV